MENIVVDDFIVVEDGKRLFESKIMPINGTRLSYRIDNPRGEAGPGNQRHIHIIAKSGELFAMNVDGSAHDGCHGVQIPDTVVDFIKKKGFSVPDNHIIEMVNVDMPIHLLVEDRECEEKKACLLTISVKELKDMCGILAVVVNVAKSFKIGIADYNTLVHLPEVNNIKILYKTNEKNYALFFFKDVVRFCQGESSFRGGCNLIGKNGMLMTPYVVYITWE